MSAESHSVQEKAAGLGLLAAGATQREAAIASGVPHTTIARWATGKDLVNDKDKLESAIERTSEEFRIGFEHVIRLALGAATPEKLEKANFAQLMTGAGIAIDKRQLLLGRPTQIVQNQHDTEHIRLAFQAAFAESALAIGEFLQFCVDQAEMEGDHELAKLLPQIIEVEALP